MSQLKPYAGENDGVFFVECEDGDLLETVGSLRGGIISDDVLVVAARKDTVDGFNGKMASVDSGRRVSFKTLLTVGDPVICTKNHYDVGVLNGHLGSVVECSDEGLSVLWDGDSKPLLVEPEMWADIELAYAITCHKAQGSACDYAIVPIEQTKLLTCEWLYTSVTRARKGVIFVGKLQTLQAGLKRRSSRQVGFRPEFVFLEAA